ncbi:hypothetical protein AWU65_14725 [Paenibacillus glucanolyticus]|uniref:Uncharacterized protein n=1 Tax=Paenibacillus glucanolyticus TaxID=59843 RepID=A0A163KA78_9BACL|nr:hypothetical protein [Paenibacillus glucanolyticus]KZS47089.1 hypothetical protein AWU65_14725 [Paenibacillus glucanolyticus]
MARVTALLGAGASVDIGGPLSVDLTYRVRARVQEIYDPKTQNINRVPFFNEVPTKLDNYFSPEKVILRIYFMRLKASLHSHEDGDQGLLKNSNLI